MPVTAMARGKYQQWLEPANLERIVNWAANGLTIAEMARSMGIGERTLYEWIEKHPQISQAIKEGLALSCEVVENALFRKATGAIVLEDTVEEYKGELRDGKPSNGTVTRRTTRRQVPPDTAAMIFYLKNRMPDRYSDRRTMEVETAMPTVVLGIDPRRADG